MKIIKQLFKSLEKQGLFKGHLHYKYRAYIFSKDSGIQEVALEKPLSQRESSQDGVEVETVIPAGKKESRLLSRLIVVLLTLVVGLLVFIVYLNKKMAEPEIDPFELKGPTDTQTVVDPNMDKKVPLTDSTEDLANSTEEDPIETGRDSGEPKKNIQKTETGYPEKTPEDQVEPKIEKKEDRAESKKSPLYQDTVTIRDISPRLIREYNQYLRTIRIDLPRRAKVSGYVNINLFVNEKGQVYQFQISDAGISIKPKSKRNLVVLRLKTVISKLQFTPPRDKYERAVTMENWRLNFLVTQFKRKMILRKQ